MKFIALAQDPSSQVELFKVIGMSPANPLAAELIPSEMRRYDATQPENLANQIPFNVSGTASTSRTSRRNTWT